MFVANVSVAEAARRLGVSVPRIHQRIADGSLNAERIGSQWVVDELSYDEVADRLSIRPAAARLRVSRALRRLAAAVPREEL